MFLLQLDMPRLTDIHGIPHFFCGEGEEWRMVERKCEKEEMGREEGEATIWM
jgi:hypothetical protein